MEKVKALSIGLGIFSILLDAQAFIRSRASSGTPLYWAGTAPSLVLYVNPTNNNELSHQTIKDMINYSIEQWNDNGNISISANYSTEYTPEEERMDLYFNKSSDPDPFPFGRGVLAVTEIFYYTNGRITEADIIINDDTVYSDAIDPDNAVYLANIISHEMGHLLGLGHGQVHESTMTFRVFPGQHSLHSDDKEALSHSYPLPASHPSYTPRGTIKGTLVGFNSSLRSTRSVFGAHVQAISPSSRTVLASRVTDPSGHFSLSLPIHNTYYLYISPIRSSANLPEYLKTVETNFCPKGESWQGAYFQKCGNDQKGHPQGLHLTTNNQIINVGTVTIRCEFPTPLNYSSTGNHNITMTTENPGEAVTGFFLQTSIDANSSQEILQNSNTRVSDTYSVDLTGYSQSDPLKNLYLDVQIVGQRVYSPLRMNVLVRGAGSSVGDDTILPSSDFNKVYAIDEDGHQSSSKRKIFLLDYSVHIQLDKTTPANNSFTVELIPQPLTRAGVFNNENFFPSYNLFSNPLSHYMMIFTISEETESGGLRILERKDHSPYEDNSSCPEGTTTSRIEGHTPYEGVVERFPKRRRWSLTNYFAEQ